MPFSVQAVVLPARRDGLEWLCWQVTTTTYGDGSPSVSRTYWPDGKPKTVSTSDGSTWNYAYSSLRLLATETLSSGGSDYRFARSYDTQGHLACPWSARTPASSRTNTPMTPTATSPASRTTRKTSSAAAWATTTSTG